MATRTIAFRLNDKNREDKEIMEWLDKAVYEGEYYDSLTEAVKWQFCVLSVEKSVFGKR